MAVMDIGTRERENVRRPAEPTGDPAVDNAVHSLKADLAEMEDRLVKRFDEVDADLKAIKDHLGIGDGA